MESKTHTLITATDAGKNCEHSKPAWIQGRRTYGWTADSKSIHFLRNNQGFFTLWRYDLASKTETQIKGLDAYTDLDQLAISQTSSDIAVIASSTQTPSQVISFNPESDSIRIHSRSIALNLSPDTFMKAEAISWTGDDGEAVYGLYYAPISDRYESAGKPPLMVMIHGGPTSQTTATFDYKSQFFATRGFAVLQVNHRGSTGYGRTYMNKLRGQWGVCDVEDSISGAQHLIDTGQADGDKIVIMGGSAGGFTVLQSLVTKPKFYAAGVAMYGIANQFMLVQDTHKFEERYSDSMLGALPEASDIYRERSPYFQIDNLVDPVILLQGENDNVVPRNQSDSIVASLRRRGVPHEYHVYEGEGHGFRKPDTIEHYLNAIIKFLTQHVIYK